MEKKRIGNTLPPSVVLQGTRSHIRSRIFRLGGISGFRSKDPEGVFPDVLCGSFALFGFSRGRLFCAGSHEVEDLGCAPLVFIGASICGERLLDFDYAGCFCEGWNTASKPTLRLAVSGLSCGMGNGWYRGSPGKKALLPPIKERRVKSRAMFAPNIFSHGPCEEHRRANVRGSSCILVVVPSHPN